MSVTGLTKDAETLSMTITAEYDVPAERAWLLWADPRQLERWWGPPTHPATVVDHDLVPGGRISYFMTGPDGETYPGWWRVLEVAAPRRLAVQDGFSGPDGEPDDSMPTSRMTVTIDDRDGGGVAVTIVSVFGSLEAMEQVLAMGMEEGILAALGQVDAILADAA